MNKKHQSARAHSRSIHQPPASGQRPRPATRQDVKTAVKELIDYHHAFERFFQRHEQADWSWFYLCGQLSNLERKTIEPMVLALLGAVPNAVRDLQRFMSQSEWDMRGNTAGILARSRIARKGFTWDMSVGGAMASWMNDCIFRRSGLTQIIVCCERPVVCRRTFDFKPRVSWHWICCRKWMSAA